MSSKKIQLVHFNMYILQTYLLLTLCTIQSGCLFKKYKRSNINLSHDYHDYNSMTKYLQEFVSHYSEIATLYSIGKSVQNRDLWVVKINSKYNNDTNLNDIKLIGNIHGNEAVGKEILLHFLMYLADNYENDARIIHILKHNNLHILPSLNPDGFEKSVVGRCSHGPGRTNARSIDLNRNFPEFNREYEGSMQPETMSVLKWMNETKFILSASLHGGALVANYPLDQADDDDSQESITPDDDVFKHLALTYSKAHTTMHLGQGCRGDDVKFDNGITNGAAWYSFEGGMQDYNYEMYGCMELTLEISCCKYPWPSTLKSFFDENKDALIEYCLQSGLGVKGTINDITTNVSIANAALKIHNRNVTFYTSESGDFVKILLPGKYVLQISVSNYENKEVQFEVFETEFNAYPKMTVLNIFLKPL